MVVELMREELTRTQGSRLRILKRELERRAIQHTLDSAQQICRVHWL